MKGLIGKRLIVMSILVLIPVTIVGFSLNGGTIPRNQPEIDNPIEKIEFQTISKGYFSRHRTQAYCVIQNEDEWINLWYRHDISMPQRSPPQVDFSESTIIAVFMGEFNTGGYGIEIKNILDKDHSVVVKVEKTYPGKGCCVIEAFTYPYHIIQTDKIDKEIYFDTVERTIECSVDAYHIIFIVLNVEK